MRVLVTGITGFVGSHFAEYALSQGAAVVGTFRHRSNLEHLSGFRDRVRLIEGDLRDLTSVERLLDHAEPDWIIHLAAQSFVGASWHTPAETLATNVLGQVNLLEAVRASCVPPWPRILVIGSSEEYGLVAEDELPIRETHPLRPLSPYAVSKVAQDLMGYQYWQSYGLPIIRARAFNHEGPRRGEAFVTSNFAKQVAQIEQRRWPPRLLVGNLTARRDYTDVRDIVRGYWKILEAGAPGEVYNLCSGRTWLIEEVLRFLIHEAGLEGRVEVLTDPARLRPSDVPVLLGCADKLHDALGWVPQIPFEQTLRDTLDYWRARV